MDIREAVRKHLELKEHFGTRTGQEIEDWHKSCVFRMNWYQANVDIIEKQHERIGIPVSKDHYLYNYYISQETFWYEQWMKSTGDKMLWREYKQLEGDIEAFKSSQDSQMKNIIGALQTGKNQIQLNLPFLLATEE